MSLRESPVRRHQARRPPWLAALLVAVAVLVVVGLGYGIVSLVRGSGETDATAEPDPTPTPCETVLVPAGDTLPAPAKVTVNVYNATATAGLASKTATALEDRGFAVGKVANDPADRDITGVGEIRFGPKAADDARLLLLFVPGAELVELKRQGPRVDLAMGDAFAGLAPEQEVNAALSSPSPVPSGVGCESQAP
jgi:hypothetical protein